METKMKTFVIFATFLSSILSFPPLQIKIPPKLHTFQHPPLIGKQTDRTNHSDLLPPSLDPQFYILRLQPVLHSEPEIKLEEWTAPGSVIIVGTAVDATNKIVLHRGASLKIHQNTIQVFDEKNTTIPIATLDDEQNSDTFGITIATSLVIGQTYTVSMKFLAVIDGDEQMGLYRGFYNDSCGTEKRLALTQFQFFGARLAFPCFDEPSFKSNFTISIARKQDSEYHTLSNAAKEKSGVKDPELPRGWVYDHYLETVKMPTYLVAIIVSDFSSQQAPAELYHKPIAIYGAPKLIEDRKGALFAAEASAKIMKKLEEIFIYPYEMTKLDSFALPEDYFYNVGMENWGLVFYTEDGIICYPNQTSEILREAIGNLIAHELAHQWFGNLVTCKWWSHFWLNEGITSYVTQLVLDGAYSEFEERRNFLFGTVQATLALDVGRPDPLVYVNRTSVPNDFTIIYDKGSCIARMMEGFLGYDLLIRAFQEYLRRFAYKSVEQDDLFKTLQEFATGKIPADKTVKDIMDTWTRQPGYPLITVGKVDDIQIYISQLRFEPFGDTSPKEETWEVPISVKTAECPQNPNDILTIWLAKDASSICYEHDTSQWILLNPDGYGYYRVMYDDALLKLLQEQLRADKTKISGLSRSKLIDDYFSLASLGHVNMTTALDLLSYLGTGEDDFVVWYTLFFHLNKARVMFVNLDFKVFQEFFSPKIERTLEGIKWEQDPMEAGAKVIFRSHLVDWACALESTGCKTTARKLFAIWKKEPAKNPISIDLQAVLYCAIVAHGGAEAFEFFMKLFTEAVTESHKQAFLNALCCATDMVIIDKMINLALDPYSELGNYTLQVFEALGANSVCVRYLFDKIIDGEMFQKLKNHTGNHRALVFTIYSLSFYLNTDEDLVALQTFIDCNRDEFADFMDTLEHILVYIRKNILWVKNYYYDMQSWFKKHADETRK